MKKIITTALATLLIVITMIGITACGSNDSADAPDPSDMAGTWELVGWEKDGVERSAEEYGVSLKSSMVFYDDGKVIAKLSSNDQEGTWKLDGNKVEVTVGEATQSGKIKNGRLYLGNKGEEYSIYEKKQ